MRGAESQVALVAHKAVGVAELVDIGISEAFAGGDDRVTENAGFFAASGSV